MEKYIYIAIVLYILIISVIGWILPIVDKKRAKKNEWRIKEQTLFIVSILGGSLAMYASMKKYRHKTKHKRFMIGIPAIIVMQLIIIILVVYYISGKILI